MLSMTHYLEYIIEFKDPVDIFDLIYKLKILTRNDFSDGKNGITICRLSSHAICGRMYYEPVHRFANSNFIKNMQTYGINMMARFIQVSK